MTGKVIDSGANSTLLVILPLALAIAVLFVAWPLFVGLFVIGLAWKLWQTYQWQQLSNQINPIFNQLVQASQGCLTVLDMSVKANLNASTAKWYLERKAEEYGAVRRLYEDRGVVYYFLTANALGSIFDDSEPEIEEELAPKRTPSPITTSSVVDPEEIEAKTVHIVKETATQLITENQETHKSPTQIGKIQTSSPKQPPSNAPPADESPPASTSLSETKLENAYSGLNQSELAKRLEVHAGTISKRKSDPDFPLWSQSKDPDGIPWQYIEESKVFVTLEPEIESS
jgi:hypothetical protein